MPIQPNTSPTPQSLSINGFVPQVDLLSGLALPVLAGTTFSSPQIVGNGFNSLMILGRHTQALGGTLQVHLEAIDPLTSVPVTDGVLILVAVGGSGASQAYQGNYSAFISGSIGPLWLFRLNFVAGAQNITALAGRLWLTNT